MKLMNRSTVGRKLADYRVVTVLALVAMTVAASVSKRNVMQADRKEQVRIAVEGRGAWSTSMPEEWRPESWTGRRHNGRRRRCGRFATAAQEYFWINDRAPCMVMHPIIPELEGKDLAEVKDPNGKRLFVEMVQVAGNAGRRVRGLHVATTRQRYRGCEGVVRQGVRALGLGGRLRGLSRRHRCGDPEGCLDHRRDRPVVDRPGCRLLDLHQSQHRDPALHGGCRRDRQGQTRQ